MDTYMHLSARQHAQSTTYTHLPRHHEGNAVSVRAAHAEYSVVHTHSSAFLLLLLPLLSLQSIDRLEDMHILARIFLPQET